MPLGMSTLDSVQGPQIYLGSLSAWLQTKTPMPQAWLPWLQTRGPGYKPGGPRHIQGLQLLGYKPRLPCPRHGYPSYKPGALVTNLGSSTAWLQTKTSMPQAWVPWLQTRGPGYKPRVFINIGPRSHTPGVHWGPQISSRVLAILQENGSRCCM